MAGKTFVEKILGGNAGSIVFKKPDIILSHDNSASIEKIFRNMKGQEVFDADQLMIVLDHNAPPTNSNLANNYQQTRNFVKDQGIKKFHDAGEGICHQIMANYAKPGMIIVGSDSHTCTAGAFNAFAAGIDRTETAGLWKTGETWFRIPESIKIELTGKFNEGVYAKDLALFIIGTLGASGANYMSVEFTGTGVKSLSVSDRMTLANLASEMGAKNAVFPCDDVLMNYFQGTAQKPVVADKDAEYIKALEICLDEMSPMVACPHQVENVKMVADVEGIPVQQALIGTCTNGRIEDLRVVAGILKGKTIPKGFQLLVTPASRNIYLQALREGILEVLIQAGANILTPSCGPCLGTGQGIPADGVNVISTANRNFLGRMGNIKSSVYLASPATVAWSAIAGEIRNPNSQVKSISLPMTDKNETKVSISSNENRYFDGVWNYKDVDNLNTDQMFAGNLTYEISSAEPEKIKPHLMEGFDPSFAEKVTNGDTIFCGHNFGSGSSREHPSVGLAYAGIKAVVTKSVSRIFFRSAINQGLPVIVLPEAVKAYQPGDKVDVNLGKGEISIHGKIYKFSPLPSKLMQILNNGGLVKSILSK